MVMKVLIHYGDRIEEVELFDCSEAPRSIEMAMVENLSDFNKRYQHATPCCHRVPIKAFLSGMADGFPLYRCVPGSEAR